MERYEEIQLTEQETDEALRKGREEKFYRLKLQNFSNGLKTLRTLGNFSAEQYYTAFTNIFPIDERGPEKEYSIIVKRLCCYFTQDPRFETGDYKRNKGILLFGGVGVGKTTLMQMFRQNQSYSYRVISCRDIEGDFAIKGQEVIEQFSENVQLAVNANPYGHQEAGYCFDDLGTENSVTKHFGNAKNVMTDIILNRYDRVKMLTPEGEQADFRGTHMTTNLTAEEIEKLYGTRFIDRLREMMNLIAFPDKAESRR